MSISLRDLIKQGITTFESDPEETLNKFKDVNLIANENGLYLVQIAAIIFISMTLWKLKNTKDSEEQFSEVLQLVDNIDSNRAKSILLFLNSMGSFFYKENNLDFAEQVWQRVLEIDPDTPAALNNLGHLFNKKNNYEKAATVFEKSADLDNNPNLSRERYINAGLLFLRIGNPVRAFKNFECSVKTKAVEPSIGNSELSELLSPSIIKILRNTSSQLTLEASIKRELLESGLRFFNELGDAKNLAESSFLLGEFEKEQGFEDDAVQNWRIALDFAKKSNRIDILLKAALELALFAYESEEYDFAIRLLEKSLDITEGISSEPELSLRNKAGEFLNSILRLMSQLSVEKEPPAIEVVPQVQEDFMFLETDISLDITTESHDDILRDIPPLTGEINVMEGLTSIQIPEEDNDFEERDVDETRDSVETHLKDLGYEIRRSVNIRGLTVDTVATRGRVRKRRIIMNYAANAAEASISAFLIAGVQETDAVKIIFLVSGNPEEVSQDHDVLIVRSALEIPA